MMTFHRSRAMRLMPAALHLTRADVLKIFGAAILALWLLVVLGHPTRLDGPSGSALESAANALPSLKTYLIVLLGAGLIVSSTMTAYCGLYWRKRVQMNRRAEVMSWLDKYNVMSTVLCIVFFVSVILAFVAWQVARLILG